MSARWRHVVWDWNGTLFDDSALCVDCMNTLLARRGIPELTCGRYQEIFDFPVIEYYRRVGFDFDKESFEQLGTEFMAEYERRKYECGLQPGALNTLEHMRAAGLTQSVLSAYRQDTLEDLTRHFDVRHFFVRVIGAADHYANGKVEQGMSWIRELEMAPAEVVLVGDTVHDFEVAQAMGTACLLIPCGNHARARLESCGAPVLEGLPEAALAIVGVQPSG